jgi:hypothetical protein
MKMKMKKYIGEFIPVILILFYVLYKLQFLYFTHSVLGKLVLLCVVIFYTTIDKLLGTFLGLLFILYYQSDFAEGFHSIHDGGGGEDGGEPVVVAEFKEKHCSVTGELRDGSNNIVKQGMIEHVFPELSFSPLNQELPCHPCDNKCKFSIIENKMKTEQLIYMPPQIQQLRDYMRDGWMASMGVLSNTFARFV